MVNINKMGLQVHSTCLHSPQAQDYALALAAERSADLVAVHVWTFVLRLTNYSGSCATMLQQCLSSKAHTVTTRNSRACKTCSKSKLGATKPAWLHSPPLQGVLQAFGLPLPARGNQTRAWRVTFAALNPCAPNVKMPQLHYTSSDWTP
jgi:hypothetical protein